MACYEIMIPDRAEGLRVDEAIRRYLPQLPALDVQKSFRRRDVKADGVRVRQDFRVRSGMRIQVYCMEPTLPSLDIVYEDGDVLIINKRAGISVEKDDPEGSGGVSLTELCVRHVREKEPSAFAHACHRLDNRTCGLVVFAKNEQAEQTLVRTFRERTLDKRYVCLVRGIMKPPAARCQAWMTKDAKAGRVTIHDAPLPGARTVVTDYETVEAGPVSRLFVHPITGRTHQIRAHMAALGHPLLGDDIYGDRALNRTQGARRLMLCAQRLQMDTGGALPQIDGRVFEIECPF